MRERHFGILFKSKDGWRTKVAGQPHLWCVAFLHILHHLWIYPQLLKQVLLPSSVNKYIGYQARETLWTNRGGNKPHSPEISGRSWMSFLKWHSRPPHVYEVLLKHFLTTWMTFEILPTHQCACVSLAFSILEEGKVGCLRNPLFFFPPALYPRELVDNNNNKKQMEKMRSGRAFRRKGKGTVALFSYYRAHASYFLNLEPLSETWNGFPKENQSGGEDREEAPWIRQREGVAT